LNANAVSANEVRKMIFTINYVRRHTCFTKHSEKPQKIFKTFAAEFRYVLQHTCFQTG
jgi:hypothetical protein